MEFIGLKKNTRIEEIWQKSPYSSIKLSSYFNVYDDLLSKFRGSAITFVEIGVFNGGSLFMWREFLGPNARIIGIDFNPAAKKWEEYGFEIWIGNQSDGKFWDDFFKEVGDVDVILDDGGHTFEQQIITADKCIPFIKDGGLLIVEDTHTSYMKKFGYPSKYSFIEWVKYLIDNINSRYEKVNISKLKYNKSIYSICVFDSIVAFRIDRPKCIESKLISNNKETSDAEDFRFKDIERSLWLTIRFSSKISKFIKKVLVKYLNKKRISRLKRYFDDN